jgi:hypothetical protein
MKSLNLQVTTFCPSSLHNTVADTILQLEYDPKINKTNEYTHAMLCVEPEELNVQQ